VKQARRDYRDEAAALPVGCLHFIDESGINLGLTRRYGRAAPGIRVEDAVPFNPGPNVSVIGALSVRGIGAVMSLEGATDGPVFLAYIREVLAPTLAQGDVVVMDNLRVHKVAGVREAIEAAGAKLLYLSPYSPDLSPIEPCWSKLKTALRAAKARTREALDEALAAALATITPGDAQHWFSHCGYALH
jgi:transposase